MAPTIDWLTKVITVPIGDLTLVSGVNYDWDIDAFRLDLKDIEDSQQGMAHLDTHEHTGEKTLAGITYARFVEIINGYTVTLPNSAIKVTAFGANHNIVDVLNLNLAQLITNNSAGLVNVTQVNQVWALHGLDPANPLDVTTTTRDTGDISQTFTEPVAGTTRVTTI